MAKFEWIAGSGSLQDPNNWEQFDPPPPPPPPPAPPLPRLPPTLADDAFIDAGGISLTGFLTVAGVHFGGGPISLDGASVFTFFEFEVNASLIVNSGSVVEGGDPGNEEIGSNGGA